VILLHGWNGELGYRFQFPYVAWRLRQAGINVALMELPYHSQRKPRTEGALQNFISYDLLRTVECVRQAIADARALAGWLLAQGSPCIGLWGFSLGAWLAGLIACHDARIKFAVLLTPVVSLERAIAELAFCAPIRESLENKTLSLGRLNLASQVPLAGPENLLIVESQHDLFAPPETIEELWRAWRQPEIWRVSHGHISVLVSVPIMEDTVKWIARKARTQSSERRSAVSKPIEAQPANRS
jgi:pimeloyl-ACP methyl ester carboxylesterase